MSNSSSSASAGGSLASSGSSPSDSTNSVVELGAADLPAFCPNKRMSTWNAHPRVFLDLSHDGHARCPYCSTEYRLKAGVTVKGH